MKNIHILPTQKQSRLSIRDIDNKLCIHRPEVVYRGINQRGINQNIYITSDEVIKEGDWYIDTSVFKENIAIDSGIYQMKYFKWGIEGQGDCKKIILTTDQDLIKDDVQAIDDEFLEWFVKNPSCEYVKVEDYGNLYNFRYLILIPKEEPKQETLEEAAERLCPTSIDTFTDSGIDLSERERLIFIDGAKWQQERMYSEEEVMDMFHNLSMHLPLHYEFLVKEQFKNK